MPLTCDASYACFLQAQYSARCVVEKAVGQCPPLAIAPPPAQSELIADDLRDLQAQLPEPSPPITLSGPAEALGAAWVLAGSSMGNRAMLARRRKAGLAGPVRFFSDERLPAYFATLREVLAAPHDARTVAAAITGARATFAVFEHAFAAHALEQAA